MLYKVRASVGTEIEFDVNADSKEEAEHLVRVYAKEDVARYVKRFNVDVIKTEESVNDA